MTTLTINQNNTLKLLADAFSSRTTFVTELMQNARRAGATEIRFHIQENRLTVTDNGCGIDDFGKLLTLCESGWSQDVQESDAPYGVGFLSAIMASSEFTVTSNGKKLSAVTDELLAGVPASIVDDEEAAGTQISLSLRTMFDLRNTLVVAARTFPLDVYFQGLQLPRTVSTDKAPYQAWVEGLGTLVWSGVVSTYLDNAGFALQGLPIRFAKGNDPYGQRTHSEWVVHLDRTKFRGRMPDREAVIWQPEFEGLTDKVQEAQKDLLRQCWVENCECPSFELYRLVSRELPREYLEMVEVIPAGVFRRIAEEPTRAMLGEGETLDYCRVPAMSRDTLHALTYVSDFPDADSSGEIATLRVLYQNNVAEKVLAVPSWAKCREISYCDIKVECGTYDREMEEFTVATQVEPTVDVDLGRYFTLTVQPCEVVRVSLLDEDDKIVASAIETEFTPTVESVLYLTGGANTVDWYVFQQDYDFTREDDEYNWDGTRIQQLVDKFALEYKLARGKDPIVLVEAAVAHLRNRLSLSDKSYNLKFNRSGTITAVPATEQDTLLLEAKQVLIQIGGYACELPDAVSGRLREFLRKLGADV